LLYVVTYDIIDDRRRNRMAKALKDYGGRVQYSVFECLMGPKELAKLKERIAGIIDASEDSVRIYSLCGGCESYIEIFGTGGRTEDPEVYIL
jgi:CRISPR-associated protein Cas2